MGLLYFVLGALVSGYTECQERLASYIVQVGISQFAVTVRPLNTHCFHPQGIKLNVRPQDQSVRHNDSQNIGSKSCDKVEQFKRLGTTLTL